MLVDSTPVECARSRETVKRSALGDAADYGYCRKPFPVLLGLSAARDLRPRRHTQSDHGGLAQTRRARGRSGLLARTRRHRRRDPDRRQGLRRQSFRPGRQRNGRRRSSDPAARTSRGRGPHLAPIRQRIESIFWSCKGTLTLERHGAPNAPGPQRAHPATPALPRRRDLPEPPTRTPQPRTRQLLRLKPVESII